MPGALIRYDLSLPTYFSYAPAPWVRTRPMIPRSEPKGLFIRGEFGEKSEGQPRPISSHNTTHLDVPFHFDAAGADLAGVLNNGDWPADRPCLARIVTLGGQPELPGSHRRDGVTYCERVGAEVLPPVDDLRGYEALIVLTGFGAVMAAHGEAPFTHDEDGYYHVPWLDEDATQHILAAGLSLVAIDSTTVERQTSSTPHRMSGEVHGALLNHAPPVLIVECLDGSGLAQQVGYAPHEGLLQMVPRRVNAAGAEAAHSRALLYFYRDDDQGEALRTLQHTMTPEEYHG